MNLTLIKSALEKANVQFDDGLSDSEIVQIESKFNFQFPPDLKEFLQFALPVGDSWVDWRNDFKEVIDGRLDWPYEGICFDIEHNNFWPEKWGQKPERLEDRFVFAKSYLETMPKLIPVYGHRYIPDKPNLRDNPVFSVYQTDIIVYGLNLENYIQTEFWESFGRYLAVPSPQDGRYIEFWSDLAQ